jgi:protein-tyrosine phosphatase
MKVLMVCLGNICRSPMAQGVLEKYIVQHQLNWLVDSAGTNGYHDGEHPDSRAIQAAKKMNIDISQQISRQIQTSDLDQFDLILAMDTNNLNYLKSMCRNAHQLSKIQLLMEFASGSNKLTVPDPYYDNSFDHALGLIHDACTGLIRHYEKTN